MNIASLLFFIEDYPEIITKFKIVIHIENKTKENEILLQELHQSSIITNQRIKTMIFIGHLASNKPTNEEAKQKFRKTIYSTPIRGSNPALLTYSQNKIEVLDYCIPAVPLFAFRMSSLF